MVVFSTVGDCVATSLLVKNNCYDNGIALVWTIYARYAVVNKPPDFHILGFWVPWLVIVLIHVKLFT